MDNQMARRDTHARPGDQIVDKDGKTLGTVHTVGPNYYQTATGFLGLGITLYIPFDAVENCDGGVCRLNVSDSEIPNLHWDHLPIASKMGTAGGPTTGYRGAAPLTGLRDRIKEGDDVVCSDGEAIGTVHGVGPNFIEVQKGWLFPSDIYIPFGYVSDSRNGSVYLSVTCDEIRAKDWTEPPSMTVGTEQPL